MAIAKRHRNEGDKKKVFIKPKLRFTPPTDPNAMDWQASLDQMTLKERDEHIKKGQCFKCHCQGHLARDCDKQPTAGPSQSRRFIKKQETEKEKFSNTNDAYAKLRAIYKDLPESEQDGFMKKLEEEGF